MIKATELRIGNAVLKHNKFHLVTASDISTAASDLMIDYLKPILITPEILEQCGFEKMNAGWLKNSLSFYDKSESKDNDTYFGDYGTRYGIFKFQSLHQLQNLYFALTGEELTCTL